MQMRERPGHKHRELHALHFVNRVVGSSYNTIRFSILSAGFFRINLQNSYELHTKLFNINENETRPNAQRPHPS